jgi:hypothetical protein
MVDVLQLTMTTIIIEGAEQALDAGAWLEQQHIDYKLLGSATLFSDNPKYYFKFNNSKDASHFALRWR